MWGSINTPNTQQTCLQCPNIEPCRAATLALQPVKCERTKHLTGPYAALIPGATFTVPELAQLVGVPPGNAAKWASGHTQTGDLAVIGTAYTTDRYGNQHPTRIYQLQEVR